MSLAAKQLEELVRRALAVRSRAYAPYSQFQVGAAVLSSRDRIFDGCNVENASYGLTICAERNAIFSMVANGEACLKAVVIALPGAGTPCGACRQVIAEFGQDIPVFLVDAADGLIKAELNIEALLPQAFRPTSLQ